MEILHCIYKSISARELASITLLGAFLLWSIRSRDMRNSIYQVIKCLFSPKLFITIFLLYIWIATVCYIIFLIGLWNIEYTKDVILYALSAISLLMETIKYSSHVEFGRLIIKQVKYTVFISVYLNLYTLSYGWEIILQFILCFSILMIMTIEHQNKQDKTSQRLYGCLNKCNITLGYAIFIFLLYQTFSHPIISTLEMLFVGVILPFILTVFVTPYLYLFCVYGTYEEWLIRLYRSVNNKSEYKRRKILLFKKCKLNLKKIKYFEQHIKFFMVKDYNEFVNVVQQCNIGYKVITNVIK